jgi:hypothetical protein
MWYIKKGGRGVKTSIFPKIVWKCPLKSHLPISRVTIIDRFHCTGILMIRHDTFHDYDVYILVIAECPGT